LPTADLRDDRSTWPSYTWPSNLRTCSASSEERRVAELVGSGRSNHETAAELFMSAKTVEANLTRIYRKLSVRSRTELANRLNRLDSAPPHD